MTDVVDLTFEALRQRALVAVQSRNFAVDLQALAGESVAQIIEGLGTPTLSLQGVTVEFPHQQEIVVRGGFRAAIRVEVELRLYQEPNGVGHTLTLATSAPADLLPGELRKIAGLVSIDALWWTSSSRAIAAATVAVGSFRAQGLRIRAGADNLHVRLENRVLETLGLGAAVLEVALAGAAPVFSVALGLGFALPPVLKARFDRLSITADGSVTFDADVSLRLLALDLPAVRLPMLVAPDRIALRLPFPSIETPGALPFRGVSLRDNHIEIEAQLGSGSYGVAADGRFLLPKTGHGGSYRFRYGAGNTTPVPDMVELSAETLTVSDAVNLVSPVEVKLPDQIDSLATLRNAYLYYATRPGERAADGTTLDQGSTVRSSVQVFGLVGYLSADSRLEGLRASILLNPIRLGSVLALRGDGVVPPRQYAGPAFARDAFALAIDTIAGTATTALQFEFLGTAVQRVEAAIRQGALEATTRTKLAGIQDLRLKVRAGGGGCVLDGDFQFASDVDLPLFHGFNLRGLGEITGKLEVQQPYGQAAKAAVDATLKVAGFAVSTRIGIDPTDIANLAERVLRALYEEAKNILGSAVDLVKAFLQGAVQYTLAAADASARLARALVVEFNATAEKVVEIMKHAGATATQALDLVRNGAAEFGQFVYARVIDALRSGFAAAGVIGAMRDWAQQFGETLAEFAENLAWLLKQGGYAVEVIATEAWRYVQSVANKFEAFVSALAWGGVDGIQTALQLKKLGVAVDAAGKLLGPVFGTDVLKALLTPAYGAAEAARVGENVIREMTRFSRDVEREVGRFACRRLGICW
jgi:hypothetical protein